MIKYLKTALVLGAIGILAAAFTQSSDKPIEKEWISLFDGKTLNGWKASEHPGTFSVQDGNIVAHGKRAHLFYMGPVNNHDFKDFEFKVEVMTTKGSNSGIYFHTQYQDEGWPSKGYEVQVNNSFDEDPRRTGSLYAVDDIKKTVVGDNTWFTIHIKVEQRHITVTVNGKKLVDYTEPKNTDRKGQMLSSGTFALQGHDPGSKVYFKNIKVRPL